MVTFVEEVQDAKNPIEKDMILQKYGLSEPKLTEWEHIIIRVEQQYEAVHGKYAPPIEIAENAPGRTC